MGAAEPDDEPPPRETRPYLEAPGGPAEDFPAPPDADTLLRLRPYLLTAGRAEPVDQTLEIEAQVMATDLGAAEYHRLSFEYRDIVELCLTAMSVAEVASALGLHIGVARVLVADLAAQGYLLVERPSSQLTHDPNLIERLIRGLEAIR